MSKERKKAAKAAAKYKGMTPNKPVRTPNHTTKSHKVLAKEGDKTKLILSLSVIL